MEEQTQNPKQALLDTIKQSTNILVTVSTNPSVDQLAACLGLTLWLNKSGKHATAVFSGDVPSTLAFLQPAETLEKTTDSLRDFIIALDKTKADKLRYKVEDKVVKIFITPYRTSLTADDLEYSQGDFNVDMVIALGVHAQADLDGAITAHGRILHDAAVATITTGEQASELGSVSWHDVQSSSLSELVTDLGNAFGREHLDKQTATALLTGIVAETERFSNGRTTPQTMSVSAELMAAGADQQLVASKLDEPAAAIPDVPEPELVASDDTIADILNDEAAVDPATLEIEHSGEPTDDELSLPDVEAGTEATDEPATETEDTEDAASRIVSEPPTLGGTLTANTQPDDIMQEPSSDPLSTMPDPNAPLLARDHPITPPKETPAAIAAELDQPSADELQPAPPAWMPPQPWMNQGDQPTPEVAPETAATDAPAPSEGLDSARDEVERALNDSPVTPEPVAALNAQPVDLTPPAEPAPFTPPTVDQPAEVETPAAAPASPALPPLQPNDPFAPQPAPAAEPLPGTQPDYSAPVEQPFSLPLPNPVAPPADAVPPATMPNDPLAPPPVPPPMMPPNFPPVPTSDQNR